MLMLYQSFETISMKILLLKMTQITLISKTSNPD